MSSISFDMKEIDKLDKQICQLIACKPLAENDVKDLCEKVIGARNTPG